MVTITFPEHETNDKGLNVKIKCHLLEDDAMRDAGFTMTDAVGHWYYIKMIVPGDHYDLGISFNVYINMEDEEDFGIDVLDENFLQPYDYQRMINGKPVNESSIPYTVYKKVEEEMERLTELGIISGHVKGEYI